MHTDEFDTLLQQGLTDGLVGADQYNRVPDARRLLDLGHVNIKARLVVPIPMHLRIQVMYFPFLISLVDCGQCALQTGLADAAIPSKVSQSGAFAVLGAPSSYHIKPDITIKHLCFH